VGYGFEKCVLALQINSNMLWMMAGRTQTHSCWLLLWPCLGHD